MGVLTGGLSGINRCTNQVSLVGGGGEGVLIWEQSCTHFTHHVIQCVCGYFGSDMWPSCVVHLIIILK